MVHVLEAFDPLIGQSQAVELLTQAIARQRIAPAYLFVGAEGVGRSVAAACFLELLLAPTGGSGNRTTLQSRIRQRNHPDLLWVEPTYLHQGKRLTVSEAIAAGIQRKSAPLIRIEQIREVSRFIARSPLEATRSIVVIEQAETMPEAAANALLKTLEEPGQATLILLAPDTESLLPTLVSRCQRIPFYRLTTEAMADVLQRTGHADLLEVPQVLQFAQGSPGAAIMHWQKLQSVPPELLQAVDSLPSTPRQALSLAAQIDKALELEAQFWLIDYLQHQYWQASQAEPSWEGKSSQAHLLERARQQLQQRVQPRLVWEVTLLKLTTTSAGFQYQ